MKDPKAATAADIQVGARLWFKREQVMIVSRAPGRELWHCMSTGRREYSVINGRDLRIAP